MKSQTEENTGGSRTGRGAVLTRYWSRCVYTRWVKAGRRPWCKEWGFCRWTSEETSLQRQPPILTPRSMFSLLSPYENRPAVKTNHFCCLSLSTSFPLVNASATSLISSGYAHYNVPPLTWTKKIEVLIQGPVHKCPNIHFNLYSSMPTTLATRQLNFRPCNSSYYFCFPLQLRTIYSLKIKRQIKLEYVKGYSM